MGLDGITLSGSNAYIANLVISSNGTVSVCTINANGSLSGCAPSIVGSVPADVVVNGGQAYVDDMDGNVYLCTVGGGALTACVPSIAGAPFNLPIQIAIH